MPTASPSSVLSPAKKIKKAASRPAIRPGGILLYILNVHRRGSRWQPAFFSTPFPLLLQKRKRILRPHSFLSLFGERKEPPRPVKKRKRTSKTGSASRAAIASEEASSIPFPPERRKLHIRSLLLPSQIVTVSLGHNLAIWNFTTPHAILMMAVRQHVTDTATQ